MNVDRRSFMALLNKSSVRTYSKFGQVGPRPRTCRWIDGDPQGWATVYCGKEVQWGSSYCDTHHARCYKRDER